MATKTRIFSAYDPPVGEVVDCAAAGEAGRSVTRQSEAEACDINNIIKRYDAGGLLTHVNERSPQYLDISEVGDYRTALERVRATEAFFMGLPADIRSKFANDAAAFLDFMSDPANLEAAKEMGLVPEPKEGEPAGDPVPAGGAGDAIQPG